MAFDLLPDKPAWSGAEISSHDVDPKWFRHGMKHQRGFDAKDRFPPGAKARHRSLELFGQRTITKRGLKPDCRFSRDDGWLRAPGLEQRGDVGRRCAGSNDEDIASREMGSIAVGRAMRDQFGRNAAKFGGNVVECSDAGSNHDAASR